MTKNEPELFFDVNGITYGIINYSDKLRFAVPLNKMAELGVKNPQKDTATLDKLTTVLQSRAKEGRVSFPAVQHAFIDKMVKLKEKGLSFKEPLRFTFVVRPEEHINGIRTAPAEFSTHLPDKNYPQILQVDYRWFKDGYDNPAEKLPVERQIGALHELAHILHGGYFKSAELGWIGEGFAEAVPYYLMDMEHQDKAHHTALLNLQKKDICTLDFIDTFGCFAFGREQKKRVQDLRTYQSVYLWFTGYIKRIEKIKKCTKFEATGLILNEFADIEREPDKAKRLERLAAFAAISVAALKSDKTLQLEGQKHIADIIQHPYVPRLTDIRQQHTYALRLTDTLQKTPYLKGVEHIGILFQNVLPRYLNVDKTPRPFSRAERQMVYYMERLRNKYSLTKTDTVAALCQKFITIGYYQKTAAEKISAIADVFNTDTTYIKTLWDTPVSKALNSAVILPRKDNSR